MRADAARRRRAIIETAVAMFRTNAIEDVTLESIAERAGVGVATLYRNFPDRHSLHVACGAFALERVARCARQARDEFSEDPQAAFDRFIKDVVSGGMGTLFLALAPSSLRDLPAEVTAERAQLIREAVSLADMAVAAELVPADSTFFSVAAELVVITRTPPASVREIDPLVTDRLIDDWLLAKRARARA